ncbi:MAG: two-component regulator propeller domain-containing protein [Saprospiraceae bacterium]
MSSRISNPKFQSSKQYKISFTFLLLIWLTLFCFSPLQVKSQEIEQVKYQVTHLGVEQGLSHNSIRRLFQDSRGLVWILTGYGVNRYDGESFTWYDKEDGFSENKYDQIIEDGDGHLWFLNGWFRKGGMLFDIFDPLTDEVLTIDDTKDFPF